jgi:hypothetical protein
MARPSFWSAAMDACYAMYRCQYWRSAPPTRYTHRAMKKMYQYNFTRDGIFNNNIAMCWMFTFLRHPD